MNALILGITGHIGNAIARELLHRGFAITGVCRRSRTPNLKGLRIRYIHADLDEPGEIKSWFTNMDLVVDAAAPYPVTFRELAGFGIEHLLGKAESRTRRILAAVARTRTPLAFVSSFGTLPQRRDGLDRIAIELIQRLHPYFAVKDRVEAQVLALAHTGHPVVVINPSGCLGPWDCKSAHRCFVPALIRGQIPAATNQMLNVIDVRDVAAGLAAAVEQRMFGRRIALVGHNLSNEMLFRWICEIAKVQPPRLVAPSDAGVVSSYLTEIALNAIGAEAPLPALVAMLTYMHSYLPRSSEQHELRLKLRPLSATLVDSIGWYREIGYC